MRVVQVVPSLKLSQGGLPRSARHLCLSLNSNNVQTQLFYMDDGSDEKLICEKNAKDCVAVKGYRSDRLRISWSPHFKRNICNYCRENQVDIIHVNSLWDTVSHSAVMAARKCRIPLVISPRGTMADPTWEYKSWKKKIALALYQDRDLRSAQMLHATSIDEMHDIRRRGYRNPIAVISNGVEIPELVVPERKPDKRTKTMLFVSRIHPNKGLQLLVDAWARVNSEGWKCVIAGPDEVGYQTEIISLVKKYGLESAFDFVGEVYGQSKANLFRGCDVFILPTQSENFGIAIAEALSYAKPVITTTGAPWRDLIDYQCGWWVHPDVSSIATALSDAMQKPDHVLEEMGKNGRKLVMEKYRWDKVGADMKAAYTWMLDRRNPKPDYVYLD